MQVDLDSDLAALIDSRDNREWAPEIRGWRDTLLREFADGAAAARFAQDPAMRDRGFLAVRKLGEFARVARLVGVMNLPLNCDYRRLAATLDDAANVIRILMGEALFNAGLSDGGLIIQVPRRRAAPAPRRAGACRPQGSPGSWKKASNDDWGDGIAAYRALLDELRSPQRVRSSRSISARNCWRRSSTTGQQVSRQDPEALRQLAATTPVEIGRLTRLRDIASDAEARHDDRSRRSRVDSAFEQALQLFIDGFARARSGARLIDLAMPLPLAAQQADEEDRDARRILRDRRSAWRARARRSSASCPAADAASTSCGARCSSTRCSTTSIAQSICSRKVRDGRRSGATEEQRASIYGIMARNMSERARLRHAGGRV